MLSKQAKFFRVARNALLNINKTLRRDRTCEFANTAEQTDFIDGSIKDLEAVLGPLFEAKAVMPNGNLSLELTPSQLIFLIDLNKASFAMIEHGAKLNAQRIEKGINCTGFLNEIIAEDDEDACGHLFARGLEDQIVDEATERLMMSRQTELQKSIEYLVQSMVSGIGDSYHGINTTHAYFKDYLSLILANKEKSDPLDQQVQGIDDNIVRVDFLKKKPSQGAASDKNRWALDQA